MKTAVFFTDFLDQIVMLNEPGRMVVFQGQKEASKNEGSVAGSREKIAFIIVGKLGHGLSMGVAVGFQMGQPLCSLDEAQTLLTLGLVETITGFRTAVWC